MAVKIINESGSNITVFSSLNNHIYHVKDLQYILLNLVITHPEVNSQVTFSAKDDKDDRPILLNGRNTLSFTPKPDCNQVTTVTATSPTSKRGGSELGVPIQVSLSIDQI